MSRSAGSMGRQWARCAQDTKSLAVTSSCPSLPGLHDLIKSYFISSSLRGRYCRPDFTGEEAEALNGETSCPRSHVK